MSNIEDFLEQISYFPIDVRRNMNLIKELSLLEDKSIKQLEKAQTDIKMLLGINQSAERDFLVNSHKQTIQRLHLQLLALHRERINCAEYISYHLNIYQKQLDIELDNYVEELKKLPPEQEEVMVRKSTRDFIKLEPPKPANAKRKNKLEFEPQIDDTNNKPYCECQRPSFGPMVACDNPHCKFEWFHLECLNLKEIPPEDQGWFCPRCASQRFQ